MLKIAILILSLIHTACGERELTESNRKVSSSDDATVSVDHNSAMVNNHQNWSDNSLHL